MRKSELKARLHKLEEGQGKTDESESIAAEVRAREVLDSLLPDIPAVTRRVQMEPYGFTTITDKPAVFSRVRIEELSDRIQAQCLTDADREVLESLAQQIAQELQFLGWTAAAFVNRQAYLSRWLEAYVNGTTDTLPEYAEFMGCPASFGDRGSDE